MSHMWDMDFRETLGETYDWAYPIRARTHAQADFSKSLHQREGLVKIIIWLAIYLYVGSYYLFIRN